MKRVLFSVCISILVLPSAYTFGFSTKGEDCAKCHVLTKDEATTIVKNFNPGLSVIDIKSAPVQGLWEVTVSTGGQKVLGYIDFSKQYFVKGEIIDIKNKVNLSRDRLTEINKVDVSSIPLDDALVLGDKNAEHKIIVFDDPVCPYCARLHQEMKKVIEKRKDIAFLIKMYPLPMHKGADEKAKAIVCEKSIALLEDSFAHKDLPAAKCTTSAIDDNMKLAGKLGISGTPAIIFPDGRVMAGFMEADPLIQALEKK